MGVQDHIIVQGVGVKETLWEQTAVRGPIINVLSWVSGQPQRGYNQVSDGISLNVIHGATLTLGPHLFRWGDPKSFPSPFLQVSLLLVSFTLIPAFSPWEINWIKLLSLDPPWNFIEPPFPKTMFCSCLQAADKMACQLPPLWNQVWPFGRPSLFSISCGPQALSMVGRIMTPQRCIYILIPRTHHDVALSGKRDFAG